jgi:hypothetical protein
MVRTFNSNGTDVQYHALMLDAFAVMSIFVLIIALPERSWSWNLWLQYVCFAVMSCIWLYAILHVLKVV